MSDQSAPAFQPKTTVLQEEKDDLAAYAKAIAQLTVTVEQELPEGGGLALSQLRRPGSRISLQSLEKVALALVTDGKLRVKYVQSLRGNSAYALYFVVGGQ